MSAPNALILMSDEHQAVALGCAGHAIARTPHLDQLAARGMRFTNAYTPSPICVPARASFATGDWVHNIRHWDNAMPYTGSHKGWGHALQDASIPVESIGKLHYRYAEDPAGFDIEHIPMNVAGGVGMVWGSIRNPPTLKDASKRMLGDYIGPGDSTYTDYDRAVTDRTIEWLNERSASGSGPWCLYVGLVAPHFPLVAPQEFFDLYPFDSLPPLKLHPQDGHERHPWPLAQSDFMDSESRFRDEDERLAAVAAYFALVSFLDHNIGQILTALEATGFADNTRVFYTSDHGDNVGARGFWGKSNLYEESAAIPLIAAGPGIEAGTCHTPVNLIDFAPTLLENFDLRDAEISSRPGQSLFSTMTEPYDAEKVTFSEYHAVGSSTGAFMIRRGRWKYIHYVGHAPELFDLEADPEETMDRSADPEYWSILNTLRSDLYAICDPDAVELQAHADQEALIASHGGVEAALKLGAPGATPVPKAS